MDAVLKALAEPHRRRILRLVWHREMPSGEIASHFDDLTRAAVSLHLQVLKDAGLVQLRPEGTRRLYMARHDTVAGLRTFLDEYWTSGLERLRDTAEDVERKKRRTRN